MGGEIAIRMGVFNPLFTNCVLFLDNKEGFHLFT